MLSTGATIVPSACLRCQLRQVIFRTSRRIPAAQAQQLKWTPVRGFCASNLRCQEAEGHVPKDTHGDDVKLQLTEYPLGRIHGKPGRRHRETAARLTKDAMEKPFDVILLRDVPEPREVTRARDKAHTDSQEIKPIDAAETARDILEGGIQPSAQEIHESIELLRPDITIVDGELYSRISTALKAGYNVGQLSRYLRVVLRASSGTEVKRERRQRAIPAESHVVKPLWQPGRTPLELRHSRVASLKKNQAGTKTKLIEQILRVGWNLTIQGELQQIGELETILEDWQVSYLFDTYMNERPMYETFIDSPLLRRSGEVRPHRADHVMRVVARKQDAEEITEQIRRNLQDLESLEVDLGPFNTASDHQRRASPAKGLLDQDLLQFIGKRLSCVFELKDRTKVVIHASSDVILDQARRILLSLLDLHSQSSTTSEDVILTGDNVPQVGKKQDALLVPEQPGADLKARHLGTEFGRLREPATMCRQQSADKASMRQLSEVGNDTIQATHARLLTDRLLAVRSVESMKIDKTDEESSVWTPESINHQSWHVQFCKLLQAIPKATETKGNVSASARRRKHTAVPALLGDPTSSIIQRHISGIASLLPYFSPKLGSLNPSTLVAIFVPSPFTKLGVVPLSRLPRIRLDYQINFGSEGRQSLRIVAVSAKYAEDEVRVRLPQEGTDLRMVRESNLVGFGEANSCNTEIAKFTNTLQSSLNTEHRMLHGEPIVKFRFVRKWFSDLNDPWVDYLRTNNFEFDYFFAQLEQVESLDLRPSNEHGLSTISDPKMKEILKEWPDGLLLRYRQVEGGLVGGKREELDLDYPEMWDHQTGTEERYLKMMETSLGLASALTRINRGELRAPLRGLDNSPRDESAAHSYRRGFILR